jgi:hypothetical protein
MVAMAYAWMYRMPSEALSSAGVATAVVDLCRRPGRAKAKFCVAKRKSTRAWKKVVDRAVFSVASEVAQTRAPLGRGRRIL